MVEPPPNSETLEQLRKHDSVVAELLGGTDGGTVAEVMRILAARLGYYERRYGKVRLEETLMCLHADGPTCEQIADRVHGMQTLIAVLLLASGV